MATGISHPEGNPEAPRCLSAACVTIYLISILLLLGSASGCQQPPILPIGETPSLFTPTTPSTQLASPAPPTVTNTPTIIPTLKPKTDSPTITPTATTPPGIPTYSPLIAEPRYLAVTVLDKVSFLQLYLFKTGENELYRLLEHSITYPPVAWSPDGKYLVWSSHVDDDNVRGPLLYILELATMQVEKMIDHFPEANIPQTHIDGPAWARDTRQILFTRIREIHVLNLDGTVQYLVDGVRPVWLDGSQAFAYLRLFVDPYNGKIQNYGDILRYDLETKEVKQLTEGRRVDLLASSPDGKWIAFGDLESPGAIFLMRSDGSEQSMVIDIDAGHFSWDPDGNHLFFAKDCQIYRVKLDGSMLEKVNLPKGYCYWYAALQPVN